MNRAVRRQQLKDEAAKAGRPPRALPRTGPARPAARETAQRGFLHLPRWAQDIWSELKKVVWPARDDVVHLTVVVVIITLLLGALLGAIDVGFGWLIDKTLL